MQNRGKSQKQKVRPIACTIWCMLLLFAAFSLTACGTTSEKEIQTDAGKAQDKFTVRATPEKTVNITLPVSFLTQEEDTVVTQEMVDNGLGSSDGVIKGTLNNDDTVTYTITLSKQKQLKEELAESIETHIQELVDNPDYGFAAVDHNEDFTEFDVKLDGTTLSTFVENSVLIFYTAGRYYSLYDGHEPEDIVVNFISPTTNEVSLTYHYKDFINP